MNMIMDGGHHQTQQHQHQPQQGTPPLHSPQRADLRISAMPPDVASLCPLVKQHGNINNNNNNNMHNNNESIQMSQATNLSGGKSTTLKRAFDVAFLMMPDERIKQKQADKQARLSQLLVERHQYPTDLSPRTTLAPAQSQLQLQLPLQSSPPIPLPLLEPNMELFNNVQESQRRYPPHITIRSPRIYDDPTVVIPVPDSPESLPLKSAFTKVASTRLESPVQPAPPLSPDQLSCSSMSPPVATTPPRANSANGSHSNGGAATPTCLNPNIVYHSFRPEYHFNGAFQAVNHVHAMQAQRIKQQLLYRPPMHPGNNGPTNTPNGSPNPTIGAPPDFLPGYPAFPFPPNAVAAHPFGPPELPRIVQNPAAAAILSTLIPPTLASTFSLTAQNVCAKCNISFRMTSDLVYHMRSHHKSEVACDPNRRKREEKLRCPVCQETFRERHHLTRHMTAHQDKESDQAPVGAAKASTNNDLHQMSNGSGSGGGSGGRQHAARNAGVSK